MNPVQGEPFLFQSFDAFRLVDGDLFLELVGVLLVYGVDGAVIVEKEIADVGAQQFSELRVSHLSHILNVEQHGIGEIFRKKETVLLGRKDPDAGKQFIQILFFIQFIHFQKLKYRLLVFCVHSDQGEESRIENFTFFPIKRSGSGRLFLDGGGDPVQDLIKIFFVKLGLGNVVDSPGSQHSLNVFKFRVDRQDHIVEVGIEL